MNHITEDDALIFHFSQNEADPEVRQHVESCASCNRLIEESAEFAGTLSDPASWPSDEPCGSADDAILSSLLRIEERLSAEATAAEELLRRSDADQVELHIRSQRVTAGLVTAITDRSLQLIERKPLAGERYARIAVEAAIRLSRHDYPDVLVESLRGQAWKMLANALRMIGKFDEASQALDRATEHFSDTAVPEPDLAAVDYIRASIFHTEGRLTEAAELLDGCLQVFRRYGEEARERNAKLLLAGVVERSGGTDRAIEILTDLLRQTGGGDTLFRGRILHNLGVYTLMDEPIRAESYLKQAQYCLERAGLHTEALRAAWHLGKAAWLKGDSAAAEQMLADVFDKAGVMGLEVDVALIGLDRAEISLENRDYQAVTSLCRDALLTFQLAHAPRFAAQAFSYIEQAAQKETLVSDDLAFIREFFARADDDSVVFMPPQ